MTPDDDPYKRGPLELKEMKLDEMLDSLPLVPRDQDDPAPLVQKAIRLSATTAPAALGDDDHLHDDAPERLDFPADGQASGGPSTCLTHVGEVSFAAEDDDGRLARLSNWFFDRLRKTCL